ncbi:positive regulator of sigma E, RseC/MucC [Desulfohalobium retbaense DSM 5692]|uniref:Positive regulator of sigma E, RseC/MucC n=2 Tax=Desulfohalobium TaxID=45662 RepID=C8WYR6_DESRD|nr:positive regulator of sigma E, RseC/MucC [Desulfohalobium retbaense DSM 5692]
MRCTCNPVGTQKMAFSAHDAFQAQVGDEVDVAFEATGRKLAMAVLYGVPLLAFLLGAIIGNELALFGSADLSGVVLSLTATLAAFIGIRWYSRNRLESDAEYRPVVIERYPSPPKTTEDEAPIAS